MTINTESLNYAIIFQVLPTTEILIISFPLMAEGFQTLIMSTNATWFLLAVVSLHYGHYTATIQTLPAKHSSCEHYCTMELIWLREKINKTHTGSHGILRTALYGPTHGFVWGNLFKAWPMACTLVTRMMHFMCYGIWERKMSLSGTKWDNVPTGIEDEEEGIFLWTYIRTRMKEESHSEHEKLQWGLHGRNSLFIT